MSFTPILQEKKPYKRKRGQDMLDGVELQNRFSVLSDESMDADDLEAKTNSKSRTDTQLERIKIPPIVVYGHVNDLKVLDKLQESLKEEMTLKNKENKTVIYAKNLEDYAIVEQDSKKSKVQDHTYTKSTEKLAKLVIKGLNENTDVDSIKSELQKNDLKAVEVNLLRKKVENKPEGIKIPVYIVTSAAETPVKEIVKVRRLCNTIIHWEKYKNSREVLQC